MSRLMTFYRVNVQLDEQVVKVLEQAQSTVFCRKSFFTLIYRNTIIRVFLKRGCQDCKTEHQGSDRIIKNIILKNVRRQMSKKG